MALLGGALLVGVVAQRLRIPYSVALLVAALPLQAPHLDEAFGPSLLFVFLPALVFEAAWNVDRAGLRRRWRAVTILAVPGVLLTALFVAFGLSATRQLALLPALVLGAILAATDPIAVIATFRRMHVPADLATIVEGESLFNDGVAIVLYTVTVAALAGSGRIDAAAIGEQAAFVALVGAVVGFACALVIALALVRTDDILLQVVGTIVAAYGAYLVADELHGSGIFAAVVAGIAIRAFPHFPSPEATIEVDRFWAVMAFVATTLVFVLMGLRIELGRIAHEPLLVLLTLAFVTAARVLVTYLGLPLAGVRARDERGWHHVIVCAGMRGALSVALALALPAGIPGREQIIDAAFGVVVVTMVVQGLAIAPLLTATTRARPA